MHSMLVTTVVGLAAASALHAQPRAAGAQDSAPDRHWMPAPPVFPPGAQMAVLKGDPSKAGPFTIELSMPDGYRIPPHSHPTNEHVVVRRGTFLVGMGDTLDLAAARPMARGQAGDVPARMHHYAAARGATVVAVSATGPFAMTYVNPADDPQRARATP